MCAVINESSHTALECKLRCECRAKKTVACVAWRFLRGETAITNPKVARSLGERELRNRLNLFKRGFKIYVLLVDVFSVKKLNVNSNRPVHACSCIMGNQGKIVKKQRGK